MYQGPPQTPASTPPLQEIHERQYSHHLLEIGCGTINIEATPWLRAGNIEKYNNADITLIDRTDPERMGRALESSREHFGSSFSGSIQYKKMEATALKFENESMDEILIVNVLGAARNIPVNEIVTESARVLKKDGELIIIETYTPHDAIFNTLGHGTMTSINPGELPPLLEEFAKKFAHLGLEIKAIEVPFSMSREYSGHSYIDKFAEIVNETSFALILKKIAPRLSSN